ncbi:MAG TPA: hypothetical protein VFV87_21110, partial [Pirellulaceae bacterium]|nr:hypothetical protein [Pirellulaceae bacterium]
MLLADNEVGGFLFFFVIIAIIVGFGFAIAAAQQQKQQQVLERVAQRFRGRLEPGNLFQSGQIRLRFQNYPALVKYTKVGKNSYHTHFTITWPEHHLRCEVYPQDILSGFRKLWGMEDIEIGSP